MATIKDIAKAAGVSHATVSNVLNHKGIVSAEKVKLVMDTAKAMGYRLNEAAASLRSGNAKVVSVILPDVDSVAYSHLFMAVSSVARQRGYRATLHLTRNVPALEREAILDTLSARAKYVFVVTSLTNPDEAYQELVHSGAELAFAIRGGPDYALLGKYNIAEMADDISSRVIKDGAKRVTLFSTPLRYASVSDFKERLTQKLGAAGVQINCIQSIPSQFAKHAFTVTEGMPDAVVATSEEMVEAVLRAESHLGVHIRHHYALTASRLMNSTPYDCYHVKYRQLGKALCSRLMDGCKEHVMIECVGFAHNQTFPHRRNEKTTLHLLSNDSPFTQALIRLSPRLEEDTGVRLCVTVRPTLDITKMLEHPDELSAFDLARMDMAVLSRYGRKCYLPLSRLGLHPSRWKDVLLEGIEKEYGQIGDEYFAVPFDPSCHLLFYRKDLTENPHFLRRYFETYRERSNGLVSYEQYVRAATCLEQIAKEENEGWRGSILTERPSEYLAELAALLPDGKWAGLTEKDLSDFFDRRRRLLKSSLRLTDSSWTSAVRCFAHGECAMMIAHSNYVGYLADEPLSIVSGSVGYARAPGPRSILGGGVIGALKETRHAEEAAMVLDWLFSPQTRDLLALLSGCSPCRSAYQNVEILDVYPWMGAVLDGLTTGMRRNLFPLAGPDFDQMKAEQEISYICKLAIRERMSVKEALRRLTQIG
ncbi:MAG: extracellular solute-binding protein [Eubacteriales bacterium]|nr:extracellular solute-binding protein [Eubacteriales bacterium]